MLGDKMDEKRLMLLFMLKISKKICSASWKYWKYIYYVSKCILMDKWTI
jgi:hypothetical protein